jgi:hypothetical protein
MQNKPTFQSIRFATMTLFAQSPSNPVGNSAGNAAGHRVAQPPARRASGDAAPVRAHPRQQRGTPAKRLLLVAALCSAYPAYSSALANPVDFISPAPTSPATGPASSVFKGQSANGAVDYARNAAVAEIRVETDRNNLPADGQAAVLVSFKLLDAQGQPLRTSAFVSVEASGGRILQQRAKTDELGPAKLDLDTVTPGSQIKVEQGIGQFWLLAPTSPQNVTLRLTAGAVSAQGELSFVPELRNWLSVGLLEGIVSRNSSNSSGNGANAASRFNDGFEQDISRWSRQFNNGKANYAARAAWFVKGQVAPGTLLTQSYDSDKPVRSRLLRDTNPTDPDAFYPIYGDSALTGFDARSAERFYLRLDQQKNYLLYGDFTTADELKLGNPGGTPLRKLGAYARSATGLRGHYEGENLAANAFAIHDNLKQVIEEYRANGTSGPFAVRNNHAVSNSEKVEIVVRDKNQLDRIVQTIPLTRFDDYSFEPFDGRLLFKQPIASQTPNGDPQSLRITYEVEQGGSKFWVGGVDGQVRLGEHWVLGASAVDDQNPESPYRLQSVAGAFQFGPKTRLVAELAHSDASAWQSGDQVFSTPSGQPGERQTRQSGQARRLEFSHEALTWQTSGFWQRADEGFSNTAAGIGAGRSEAGIKFSGQISDTVKLLAEGLHSKDDLNQARREAERVGLQWTPQPQLTLEVSLAHVKENGTLGNALSLAGNSALPGTNQNPNGGFFGSNSSDSVISPISGTLISQLAATPTNPASPPGAAGPQLDATTVRLGARYKVSEQWSVNGDAEHSVSGEHQRRYGLGSQYQLSERSRAYARYENQTGLGSSYSLNPQQRSTSLVAGVESTYLPGASIFSEYRLRDAISTDYANQRDMQLASGLRNTWNVATGVALNTNAEYLHVLSGSQQKGLALAAGIDYASNPLWKASAKLEWRRLFDNDAAPGDQAQQQWLSTVSYARKLARDWTLLTRNYLLATHNHDDASGKAIGNAWQDRLQFGLAWRPTDHNRFNGLTRYEYKAVHDRAQADGDDYQAHILSNHLDYHPSRPWWMTGRIAAKTVRDNKLPQAEQRYSAVLVGGRVVYDLTENWDLSALGANLRSPQGGTRQYAFGLELGYLLKENLWLSVGHNQRGFSDRDLSGADYTARGSYLRLRFKFDETLFSAKDKNVNRALAR